MENILLRSLMMGYGWNESWLGECLHLPPAPLISCFWPRRRIHEQVAAAEEGEESFSSKSSRSSSSVGVCTYRLPSAFFDCALKAMKCASLGHLSQTSIQTQNGWCIVAKWTPMIFSQIFCQHDHQVGWQLSVMERSVIITQHCSLICIYSLVAAIFRVPAHRLYRHWNRITSKTVHPSESMISSYRFVKSNVAQERVDWEE